MARRRNTNARSSAPRRRLFWARQTALRTLNGSNLASPVDLLYDFQQAYDADLFGFTVTRIVGHYTFYTDGNAAVSTTYNMSFGIKVDEQTQWTTETPDDIQAAQLPVNSPFSDWMYVRNNLGIVGGAGDSAEVQQAADNRVEVDLRAQRRMDELGQSLYALMGLNQAPGENVYVWLDLNTLCKRP